MKPLPPVTMVTRNSFKIESMREILAKFNIGLEVENFFVPEVQADSCEEVAAFSAKYAANFINKPIIKADSGLFISSLNGLPGIYTSQFQKKLGCQKVLRLLENEPDRSAKIVYALCYCEPNSEQVLFSSGSAGTISTSPKGADGMLIDFLFIPEHETHTLGELRDIDPQKRTLAWGDAEDQFAKWYLNHSSNLQ